MTHNKPTRIQLAGEAPEMLLLAAALVKQGYTIEEDASVGLYTHSGMITICLVPGAPGKYWKKLAESVIEDARQEEFRKLMEEEDLLIEQMEAIDEKTKVKIENTRLWLDQQLANETA
jgi:hypothetical protein